MEPNFLLIDTSTFESSVAVWNGKQNKYSIRKGEDRGFTETIPSLIDELREEASLPWSEFSAVVVNAGPGSYTGLRSGVSFAKGLCYGLGIPLISITSLLLIASKFRNKFSGEYFLLPLIDAGRMEVYTALLNQNLEELQAPAPIIVDDNFMNQNNLSTVYYMGSGAPKCREIFDRKGWVYLSEEASLASDLIEIAKEKYQKGEFSSLYNFEPLYLKDFIPKVKKTL